MVAAKLDHKLAMCSILHTNEPTHGSDGVATGPVHDQIVLEVVDRVRGVAHRRIGERSWGKIVGGERAA